MALGSICKELANYLLRPLNARVESLTADRREATRLTGLITARHFEKAVFPVLPGFEKCHAKPILDAVKEYESDFGKFLQYSKGDDFDLRNDYFSSPDAEVAYSIVRLFKPKRICEVGSGNSTRVLRAAVKDAVIDTQITAVDPMPRRDIRAFADTIILSNIEDVEQKDLFDSLQANDILFIDSSHEIKVGNDVLFLLLNVLPKLPLGVLIHLHDIFLPYEYPAEWIVTNRWKWTEQYLLQALLQGSSEFEVIWPGHYLQRTMRDFPKSFRFWQDRNASSFWIRRTAGC